MEYYDRTLVNGLVQGIRYRIPACGRRQSIREAVGSGGETQFSGATLDELGRLTYAFTIDQFAAGLFEEVTIPEAFQGRSAVGGHFRIGQGYMTNILIQYPGQTRHGVPGNTAKNQLPSGINHGKSSGNTCSRQLLRVTHICR